MEHDVEPLFLKNIIADIPKVTVFPSIRNEGRIPSNEPKRTMNAVVLFLPFQT